VSWLRHELSKARERRRARPQRTREVARKRPRTANSTHTKRLRIVLLAVLVGLLSAGIAYGVTTLLVGSSSPKVHSASTPRPWLGVDLVSIPLGSGVLIADVVPGGPAESAGLQPGNMITAIDGKPVSTVDDVTAALDGLHVGNQVEIQYTLGLAVPGSYTTHATLAAEPPGYP
jgi:S1-C subfamily serine protease